MKIVGVGCGPGLLTEEVIATIAAARLIYGSGRAIDLAAAHIPAGCAVHEITDYARLRELPAHAVVLSTGDPMLAGLGFLGGEVIPGISSMQVAFARLALSLTRAVVVNAHGKDHDAAVAETAAEIGRGRVVFLIADPAFAVTALAAALRETSPHCRIAVCEHLGYPGERVAVGTAADPPVPVGDLFVVVAGGF
ncbi:MAG: cobalt-precorrin-7 (C(5))-methyltransferase [Methanomicrobiaceae archaeon]|nr:cobalt-precorrin-7 (C(5))-methyltransferase [Methanomicrobiaceae archaeon]